MSRGPRRSGRYFWLIAGIAVASRLLSTIYYIEDPDSLRFALSVYDEFNVAELQPHFPGYPVFWFVASGIYLLTGHLAITFSTIGGLATVVIVWMTVRLAHQPMHESAGWILSALVLFNPLMWLMGNRYMPDLLGVAGVLTAFYLLVGERAGRQRRLAGMGMAGLMAGLRLSYLPLLVLPIGYHLLKEERRVRSLAVGAGGVLLWLVPLLIDTGWASLWEAALAQTAGHFSEFGGTVATNPDLGRRFVHLVESIWADGLGGYWPGRHPVTILVGFGLVGFGIPGISRMKEAISGRMLSLMAGSTVIYVLWIFFYQNIIHKPRHVLPLLPFLLIPIGFGIARAWQVRYRTVRAAVVLWCGACVTVTGVLVWQHREPTAIAQVRDHLADMDQDSLYVGSIDLVNYYLAGQGLEVRFFSIQDSVERVRLHRVAKKRRAVVISTSQPFSHPQPVRVDTFYHNPYVNRMWPQIQIYTYEQ